MTTTAWPIPGYPALHWPDALAAALERGPRAVLVTVADARGSTPRESGAAMVVTPDGIAGTIGGGHLEYEAIRLAREALAGTGDDGDAGGDVARAVPARRAPRPVLRRRGHARVADDRPRRRRLARDRPHLPAHAGAVRAGGDDRQRRGGGRATAGHRRRRPRHARRFGARIGGGGRGAGAAHGTSRSARGRHRHRRDRLARPCSSTSYGPSISTCSSSATVTSAARWCTCWARCRRASPGSTSGKPISRRRCRRMSRSSSPTRPTPSCAPRRRAPTSLIMTHSHTLDFDLALAALARDDWRYVGMIGSKAKRAQFERRRCRARLADRCGRACHLPDRRHDSRHLEQGAGDHRGRRRRRDPCAARKRSETRRLGGP